MTAVEGNASVYQVYAASHIPGEGRAELLSAWGLDLNKRERGGRGTGGATQSVRGHYKSYKGTNLTVIEGIHHFITYKGSAWAPASPAPCFGQGRAAP